ncbi:hypothetical protein Tco_0608013 [Tanacetum coccineum]
MSEEFEASEPSSTRTVSFHSQVSSDSTAPLAPDHPLTHVSPTSTPTRVLFHRRTVRMAVRTQPTLSPSMSTCIAEAAALSPSSFRKRYRSSSLSPTLSVRKRYRGTSELILDTDSEGDELGEEDNEEDEVDENDESQGLEDEGLGLEEEEAVPEGQQQAVLVVEIAANEPLGLGYGTLRRHELVVEEDQVPSTFEVGQSSRSVLEWQGVERVSVFRQPTLDTWVDPEDGRVYTNILAYVLLAAPVQTPPSPEWLHGSILHDHTQCLDALPPTLVADIDRDVRELYTRLGAVRDEIFLQRLVLALEAWVGHVDTRLVDMSRARYDDYRLIHDMLVQQVAMQRELQEMIGGTDI